MHVHLELQELLDCLNCLILLHLHPPPSTNQSDQSKSTAALSSSKTAASAEYTAWTTTDTRLKPSVSSILEYLHMDDDSAPDEQEDRPATPKPAWSIPSSDLPVPMNNWASALASTYVPPQVNSLLAQTGDITIFMGWFCKKQGIMELTQKDPGGNMSAKPLPMDGQPGTSPIQADFFFYTKIWKQIIPDQMWIEEECKYDIAAMYGISHWWFQRQRFYIDRHTFEGDRRAVRTHMRILSVVRIEVFSLYGYDYMKTIVLRRVDLNEYIIAERDFKYLYPSDFEDLNLVIRQRVKDFQLGIESYQTQPNLTKPRWDATGFEFNHDFTIIDSPRAVTFRDKYEVKMIMRFNEIHKFSDDTLQQIDEALDYRVKEFKVNRMNPGLNT
ncbi:hypothetical protein Tco_0362897 [Tanacetum coccineum]